MPITKLQYSAHDLCASIFLPLNCDGTPADENDDFTLTAALIGGESTFQVDEQVDPDVTPLYGELILDHTGPNEQTLGYGSITPGTPSTITLITGETVTGAVDLGDTVRIARSEPVVHCGLTQTRLVPQTTDEVVDEDPSGQANQNVARRRIAPQRNGYVFEADITSRENPILWALADQYAPIIDPAVENEVIGFEEVVSTAATCPTCGGSSGTCHSLAAILVFNAWCGEERNATFPYAAQVLRSLTFEPETENLVRGRGFNPGRILRATLRTNTAFADPWSIDPRGAGQTARWSEFGIRQTTIDGNADLSNLLTNGCGCGSCPNPEIAWPAA